MRKKGIIFATLFGVNVLVAVLQACIPCGNDAVHFKLSSIKADPKIITGIETEASGYYERKTFKVEPLASGGEGVRYDSLGIEVMNVLYSALPDGKKSGSWGINSAYACSPVETYDKVSEIIITSSEDYNAAYSKGKNLAEIMNVHYEYNVQGNNVATFMHSRRVEHLPVFFRFAYPPAESAYHTLTIKYILEDGREYEASIQNVLIRK